MTVELPVNRSLSAFSSAISTPSPLSTTEPSTPQILSSSLTAPAPFRKVFSMPMSLDGSLPSEISPGSKTASNISSRLRRFLSLPSITASRKSKSSNSHLSVLVSPPRWFISPNQSLILEQRTMVRKSPLSSKYASPLKTRYPLLSLMIIP